MKVVKFETHLIICFEKEAVFLSKTDFIENNIYMRDNYKVYCYFKLKLMFSHSQKIMKYLMNVEMELLGTQTGVYTIYMFVCFQTFVENLSVFMVTK